VTRTRASLLVVLAAIGAVGGFLVQLALGALGVQKLLPEFTLAVTLVLIAIVVVALAVPIRRATHAEVRRRVDPFYATRVVLLAKACAVAGALLTGAAAGMIAELLVRPVSASEALWRMLAMLIASVLGLVGGLVAEALCVVPPDDDEKPTTGAAA
jgi:cytochrome bd-type quinol oxidase subunit 2